MSLSIKEIKPFVSSSAGHAFQIFSTPKVTTGTEIENYIITVAPGTVNNLLPADIISGTGTLKEVTIQKDTLSYVKLQAVSDGKRINAGKIIIGNSPPSLQTPAAFNLPSSVEILLGVVYNGEIYQIIKSNIFLGGKVQYVLKATSPDVLPFVPYLIWG